MSGDSQGAKVSGYQSKYAPDTVFQPNVNTSDSDEVAARSTYQGIYGTTGTVSSDNDTKSDDKQPVKYPTLKMAYTTAPHLETLTPPHSQDSGSSSAPELNHPISINLAALLTAENSFLTATKTIVDDYQNTLVPTVKAAMASTTLFGQNVTTANTNASDPEANYGGDYSLTSINHPALVYDQLDESGKAFAASINVQMPKVLQAIGNVTELLGQFTACINQAGQLYAGTDRNSAFPAPDEMIGPVVHKGEVNGLPSVHKIPGTFGYS